MDYGLKMKNLLNEAKFDKEYEYDLKPGKKGKKIFAAILGIVVIVVLFTLIIPAIMNVGNPHTWREVFYVACALWMFIICIINPLVFMKKEKQAPVSEEIVNKE